MLPHDYLIEFFNICAREFVCIPEKKRFGKLPDILRKLAWHSSEYREFSEVMAEAARRNDCGPEDLSDSREWPKFRW